MDSKYCVSPVTPSPDSDKDHDSDFESNSTKRKRNASYFTKQDMEDYCPSESDESSNIDKEISSEEEAVEESEDESTKSEDSFDVGRSKSLIIYPKNDDIAKIARTPDLLQKIEGSY